MPQYRRFQCFFLLTTALLGVIGSSIASAQTQREFDLLRSIGKRLALAEKRSQDPFVAAMERQDVFSLLGQFRKSDDAAGRTKVANGLIKIGDPGALRLLDLLTTELKNSVKQYKRDFQAQVSKTVRDRRKGVTDADITALQKTVNDLARDPGLTKDMVVKQSDVAMSKLEEYLSIDRTAVLGDPNLKAARKRIVELSMMAKRAADSLSSKFKVVKAKTPDITQIDQELVEAEELASFMATPMSKDAIDVMFENEKITKKMKDPLEAECAKLLNLRRIRVGLQPVKIDLILGDTGRDHSNDMKKLGFFAHESPVSGKKTPWDRAKNFGTTASGENIAAGYPSPDAVIKGWWYSPGHHRNMMNPRFNRVGHGRVDKHWTQMFGS